MFCLFRISLNSNMDFDEIKFASEKQEPINRNTREDNSERTGGKRASIRIIHE